MTDWNEAEARHLLITGSIKEHCQHDPMQPDCTLRHQFTAGRTRCDICGGIFTLPVSTADSAEPNGNGEQA